MKQMTIDAWHAAMHATHSGMSLLVRAGANARARRRKTGLVDFIVSRASRSGGTALGVVNRGEDG